jgi:membrane fusion protein (multidrug efflux system)
MRRRLLIVFAALVVLGGIGYGIRAWLYSLRHVTTDDAYVESLIVPLAAKVSGHVAQLYVDDNKAVKTGDLLLKIDPRDYEAKRDQARAAVAVAAASF